MISVRGDLIINLVSILKYYWIGKKNVTIIRGIGHPNAMNSDQATMKGLDGIQGPVCIGSGCVFNRQALYGYAPSSMPNSTSQPWYKCFACLCPPKKEDKDLSEINRETKKDDLNAAIFNLKELASKSNTLIGKQCENEYLDYIYQH